MTTIDFDSGFPLHISADSPLRVMIIMLIFAQCCRLQWPAHYLGGQCLYPACAEPEPGHKELQVLAPRPSPQPVSAASQPAWSPEQPSQASERERETGDSED